MMHRVTITLDQSHIDTLDDLVKVTDKKTRSATIRELLVVFDTGHYITLTDRIADLEREALEHEIAFDSLKEQYDKIDKHNDELLSCLEAERKEIEIITKERDNLSEGFKVASDSEEKYKTLLDDATEQHAETVQQLEDATKEIQFTKTERDSLQISYDSKLKELEDWVAKANEQAVEIEELKSKRDEFENLFHDRDDLSNRRREEIINIRKAYNEHISHLSNLAQLIGYESLLKRGDYDLDKIFSELTEAIKLGNSFMQIREDRDGLQGKLDKLTLEKQNASKEAAKLKNDKEHLKVSYNKALDHLSSFAKLAGYDIETETYAIDTVSLKLAERLQHADDAISRGNDAKNRIERLEEQCTELKSIIDNLTNQLNAEKSKTFWKRLFNRGK